MTGPSAAGMLPAERHASVSVRIAIGLSGPVSSLLASAFMWLMESPLGPLATLESKLKMVFLTFRRPLFWQAPDVESFLVRVFSFGMELLQL